jgi:branched-chain amino acid transport system substrate-binding protein
MGTYNMRTFRGAVYASALLSSLVASAAQAQISDDVVKIGILTDMSGPFSDQTGQGSAVGARMAIEEFNGRIGNARIQLVVADHQEWTLSRISAVPRRRSPFKRLGRRRSVS